MSDIPLWGHQKEAIDAIVRGLSAGSDGVVPAGGLRGTVVMATGTGKTVTAAVAARRLVPRGRVGVLVPTLELLTQTIEAWRRTGRTERMIAVCSLGADPMLEALGVECTTNPTRLALWASAGGPVTIFATYASLVSQGLDDEEPQGGDEVGAVVAGAVGGGAGVLELAMRGSFGQRLDPFDLLVIDEAHRTSGDLGKAWAAVLHQERIPAVRRLFMTATPRLWETRPAAREGPGRGRARGGRGKGSEGGSAGSGGDGGDAVGGRLVASMDDAVLYGPVLFELELMEAIERGILASFEIDVLEIQDSELPGPNAGVEEVRGRRLAALQAALLTHLDETGARSLLTFHSRTVDCMAFARAMPETAAELYQMNPARYPARVRAEWLSGEHPATYRRAVLARFADGLDEDGWVTDVQFLSSCQVLGEGVDIRGKRGVDGVVFADTRSSPVQIVQIVGRALRQRPDEGKVARLVVPVFLQPGEKPADMMASASYRPLVAVLQGLRAHDERVVQRLLLSTTTARGQSTSVLALDPATDREDDRHGDEESEGAEHDRDGQQHATALDTGRAGQASTEESDPDDQPAENSAPVTGPEEDDTAPQGVAGAGVPLLRFSLPRNPDVIARFLRTRVLQPDSEVWLTGLNALRIWVEEHGNAEVPLEATVDLEDSEEPYTLGGWVSEQRRAFRAGTLKPWRIDLLNELGMVWSVADVRFERNLAAGRKYYAQTGTLAAPRDAVVDGVTVGQWLHNCRKSGGLGAREETAQARRALLEAIDPYWNPRERGWSVDWQRSYAALAHLVGDEGTLPDIQPGVRVHGINVGRWLTTQFQKWDRLSDGQRALLEALHVTPVQPKAPADSTSDAAPSGGPEETEREWAPTPVPDLDQLTAFERGLVALTQYKERTGRLVVPRQHVEVLYPAETEGEPQGEVRVRLGVWTSNTKARRAKLTDHQRQQLAELGLEWAR